MFPVTKCPEQTTTPHTCSELVCLYNPSYESWQGMWQRFTFQPFSLLFYSVICKEKNAGGNSGHWLLLSSMLRLNKYHQIHKYFDSESVLVLY